MSDAHHLFLVVASTNTCTWIPCIYYFNYETCFLPMWSPPLHSCTIGPFHPSASRGVDILLLDDCVLVMSFVTIHKATTLVGIHPHHMLCSLCHLLWATHRVVPHRAGGGCVNRCVRVCWSICVECVVLSANFLWCVSIVLHVHQ